MKFNVNSTNSCNSAVSEGYIAQNSNTLALQQQRICIPSADTFLSPSKARIGALGSHQNSPASYTTNSHHTANSPLSYQADNSPVEEVVHSVFTEAAHSGYSHLMTPDRDDEDIDMDSQLDADVEAIMSKLYLIQDNEHEHEHDDDDEEDESSTNGSWHHLNNNTAATATAATAAPTTSPNALPTTTMATNSSSGTGNASNASKKKRKKRSKSMEKEGISYHPPKSLRAQGNIQISKSLTDTIIPQRIAEEIKEVYQYMDKITAINCFENAMQLDLDANNDILVFNYGFHDRGNGELLYTVAEKQDITNNKSRGYKWKMINDLFTAAQLEQLYQIPTHALPKLFRACSRFAASVHCNEQVIRQHLQSQQFMHSLIQKVQWHKTEVFHRVNNKRRMTLSLTKPEFMQRMTDCVKAGNGTVNVVAATTTEQSKEKEEEIELIPILLFNNMENIYLIEYVWIVHLEQGIDIGLSFKYNTTNGVRVTGIHLDREYIKAQHQLIYPNHTVPSLESFTSNITNLAIGNPDDNLNKIKYYKQQIDELTVYRESLKRILNSDPSHREAVIHDLLSKTNLAEHSHRNHHQRGYNNNGNGYGNNNRPSIPKTNNNVNVAARAQHLAVASPPRQHSGRSIVSDMSRDSSRSFQSPSASIQHRQQHQQQMQQMQIQQMQQQQQQLQQQLMAQQQQQRQQQYELMQQQQMLAQQQMAYQQQQQKEYQLQRQQHVQQQQQQKQVAAQPRAQAVVNYHNYQYLQAQAQHQMYPQYTHSQ